MRLLRLAWLVPLAFAACSSGNNSGTPPDMMTAPTTGGLKGTATLGGMTSGDSGIVVGVLGGPLAYTDDAGNWAIGGLAAGTVTVQATHPGYMPAVTSADVVAGTVTMVSPLNLVPLPTTPKGGLSGHVFLFDTSNATGSMVTLSPNAGTALTAADGSWSIASVPAGVYSVTFAHAGYVAQTVGNVIVADSGTITVADVTLRRETTVVGGHSITELGASPDRSLQLLTVDGTLQVVSESSGSAVIVGAGTAARSGALAPDDKHLWLTDGNGLLWVGTTDGRSLSLVTSKWVGFAVFSANGSHLAFAANDAQSNTNIYVVSTSGGTPTTVASAPIVGLDLAGSPAASPGLVVFTNSGTDANGNATDTGHFLDLDSGVVTTMANVTYNTRANRMFNTPPYELFVTSVGTQPSTTTSIGDLYLWKPGTPPAKLSGGSGPLPDGGVNVNLPIFTGLPGQPQLAWINPSNFDSDNTTMLAVVDANAGALRPIIMHTRFPGPFAGGFPFGAFSGLPFVLPTGILALDLHDNAAVYTFDVKLIDINGGTVSTVKANAARLDNGTAGPGDGIFSYARPVLSGPFFDFRHFLVGDTRSGTGSNETVNWALFDGALHKLNDPATPISTDTFFSFSSDFRVALYATTYGPPTTSATPLTIVNLPAAGTAGDGVIVPLSASYFPPGGTFNAALSADHSTVAFFTITGGTPVSTLYKVATAPSATPVTPTQLLAADPNAGANFTWVAVSGKGDLVFTGDQSGSGANAWVVGTPGAAVALDAAGLGNARPRISALADGTRTFVSDESNDNFLVQVDTAATPTLTRIDNYVTGSAALNGAATRYFWQSSNGPALSWATASATGTVAGTWNQMFAPPPLPGGTVDPNTTYYVNPSGPLLTAFDGATGVVPLATTNRLSANLSFDGKLMLVVDRDASGINHLIASPASAPARNILADGFANTTPPPPTTATNQPAFYSPDFSTVYAWGDANAGTGNPPSWKLGAAVGTTGAVANLGGNLVNNGSATFGATQKVLFFQSVSDPLLGTFSSYASTVGTTTAVKQTDNARSVSRSIRDDSAFVLLLADGTSHVASAAGASAATAFSSGSSTNTTIAWSADGTHLFAVDGTNGNGFATVWGGAPGQGGAIYDTDVIDTLMPDFTGHNLLTIALHGTDGAVTVDHAAIP